ncbi:hypothetical protein ACFV0D_17495 [Streptomyces sp. NPDC059556]
MTRRQIAYLACTVTLVVSGMGAAGGAAHHLTGPPGNPRETLH